MEMRLFTYRQMRLGKNKSCKMSNRGIVELYDEQPNLDRLLCRQTNVLPVLAAIRC